MAITIITEPVTYSPVYNGLKYKVSSDNTNETNFQYIFDIWYDGSFRTRHRVQPNPETGYGLFDAMRIIESTMTNDPLTDLDTTFINSPNCFKKFYIEFGEEYDVAGVLTLFDGLETSADVYAYNGVYDYLDFVAYDEDDCSLINSTSSFLTNAPTNQEINIGERAWLYSRNTTPANYFRRQVKTYNSAGTLLNTYNDNNTFTDNAEDADKFIRVTCGTAQLSDEGVSFTNVSYYTVQVQNSIATAYSKLMTFTIGEGCTKYELIRLHFLNKMGGFDSFTFDRMNEKTFDIKRVDYKTNVPFTQTTSDRMNSTSNTSIKPKLMLNSNWVSQAELEWLMELVTSPIIFQELNDNLIAVKCTETKFDKKQTVNDKLFNLTVKMEYTFTNYRQRY